MNRVLAIACGMVMLGGPSAGAVSLQWVQQIGSIENKQTAYDASADAVGNVYVSGIFGDTDSSISKYDSAGELLWIREAGFTADLARGIYVSSDRLGNAYLAGSTYGDLGGPTMVSGDVILKKFDAAGNLQWSRQF